MDYNEMEQKVTQSGGEVTELRAAMSQLQAKVDRHALVIQALKDMLHARGCTEDEFAQRLQAAVNQKAAGKNCRKCERGDSPPGIFRHIASL